MKVLIIGSDINLFKPGSDVARRAIKYGRLAEKYIIISFTKKGVGKLELSDRAVVYPTNSFSKLFYVFDAFRLAKKIVLKEGIEVVSVQDPFESALVGWRLKKKFRIGLNIQVHGDFFGSDYWRKAGLKNAFRLKLAKRLLPRADSVRAVSQRIASSLGELGIPNEAITTAPIYVDWQAWQKQEGPTVLPESLAGQRFILSVGRLVPVKNLDLLIKAFAQLKRGHEDLKLVIIGDGPEKNRLEAISEGLGLKEKVIFTGWQTELSGYYRAACLTAITSESEGYNRTAIEAMACGCPLVMSDVGLAGEILINGENGLVFQAGDQNGLVISMARILAEPGLRERLVKNGLLAIQELPGEEEIMKRIKNSWQRAVNAGERHG